VYYFIVIVIYLCVFFDYVTRLMQLNRCSICNVLFYAFYVIHVMSFHCKMHGVTLMRLCRKELLNLCMAYLKRRHKVSALSAPLSVISFQRLK